MIDVKRVRADEGQILKQLRLRALGDDPQLLAARMPEVAMRPNDYWEELAATGATSEVSITFIAEFEGRPVGTLGVRLLDVGTAELVSPWVEPLARRRGTGPSLIDAAVHWARERGCSALEAWVRAETEDARETYASYGFVDVDHVSGEAATSAARVRMRLAIAD